MAGLESFKTAFEQSMDPENWEFAPDTVQAKRKSSVAEALTRVGLPLGLAAAAFGLAKRDGQGFEAAAATLKGFQEGAASASRIALERQKQMADQQSGERKDRGDAILKMLPVIDQMGGDTNALVQQFGQEQGIPAPRVPTPLERKAREMRYELSVKMLDVSNPGRFGDSLVNIADLTGDETVRQIGQSVREKSILDEDNAVSAVHSILGPVLSKLTLDQTRALFRTEDGRRLLQAALTEVARNQSKPEDPLLEEKRAKLVSETNRNDRWEPPKGPGGDPLGNVLTPTGVRVMAANLAQNAATSERPDPFNIGKPIKKFDTNKYMSEFSRLMVLHGRANGLSESTIQAFINQESNGNPAATDGLRDTLGTYGFDEFERYATGADSMEIPE